MTKFFDSSQMLKSSEDCKKFSKSVSYETLVGGTSTTGTGYKQIRRLFLSSANKPLSAVGTLTSLLCNSAKVMEYLLRHVITRRTSVRRGYLPEKCTHANKESLFASVTYFMRLPRRIQRMLLVMTIPVFAIIFTLITTTESRAETWNCGAQDEQGNYSDSVKCTYDEKTKTMTVSGKGNMGNYYHFLDENNNNSSSAPWFEKVIENVVIGDGVTSVGATAFAYNDSLKSVSGMKDVERFESKAFNLDYGVDSFVIPEKIKYIGDNALQSINGLSGQVFDLPDTLEYVQIDAIKFGGTYIVSEDLDTSNWEIGAFGHGTLNIICKGSVEKCQSNISKFIKKTEGGIGTCETEGFCNGSFSVVSANSEQCTGNYGWNGASCVKKDEDGNVTCASGFVEWDDACVDEYPFAKKRWTPAEANKWLHDGNDNFVIITFKK